MYEQPNAPLSIGGVLDNGIKLFKASFNDVIWLAIVAAFLGQLSGLMMNTNLDADGVPQVGAGLGIVMLIVMVISVVFFGAIIGRIDAKHRGAELSVGESMSLGMAAMLPLLGCFICYVLAIAIGSLLLLIPGLIVMLSMMFAPYMVVVERMGVFESLKQSHSLVWGSWWRTAAIMSIAGFILMVAYMLFAFVLGLVIFMEPDAAGGFSLAEAVFSSLFSGLVTPLFYAITLAVYYDLRIRREGGDLAARIDAAESPA